MAVTALLNSCCEYVPCTECACFNLVEPLRFTYLDNADTDLVEIGSVTIDRIMGKPIVDGIVSSEYSLINYERKSSVIDGIPAAFSFFELDLNQFSELNETELIGTDINHLCLIHRNNSIVDTLEFKWSLKVTEIDQCCTCTSFPYDYIKYNGELLSKGTDSGAAIVRL